LGVLIALDKEDFCMIFVLLLITLVAAVVSLFISLVIQGVLTSLAISTPLAQIALVSLTAVVIGWASLYCIWRWELGRLTPGINFTDLLGIGVGLGFALGTPITYSLLGLGIGRPLIQGVYTLGATIIGLIIMGLILHFLKVEFGSPEYGYEEDEEEI
jgi:hypothetical protein